MQGGGGTERAVSVDNLFVNSLQCPSSKNGSKEDLKKNELYIPIILSKNKVIKKKNNIYMSGFVFVKTIISTQVNTQSVPLKFEHYFCFPPLKYALDPNPILTRAPCHKGLRTPTPMMINKYQKQTFKYEEIDLWSNRFSLDRPYVGRSRSGN